MTTRSNGNALRSTVAKAGKPARAARAAAPARRAPTGPATEPARLAVDGLAPRPTSAARPTKPPRPKAPDQGWRRDEGDQSMTQELGVRLRAVREAKGLSLARLSELSGIPGATLSRIENSKMSPTFGVLSRVMLGLEVDWGDLVSPQHLAPGERLISFADPGAGRSSDVRGSRASVLHPHDAARSLPLLVEITDRELADVGGLSGHRGEEFCYVLSGTLVLHIEGQPPHIMKPGASALFDSTVPHAYLSGSKGGVRILIVVVRRV